MTTYESETCRIVLHKRWTGGADLYIYAKQHPDRPPMFRYYNWGEDTIWNRDLDTLLSATGAQETQGEAA